MFVYQTPKTSFQRLLINDQSGQFRIVIEIKYTNKQKDDIQIEKQKQIIINTTVNKARIISKIIDEQFSNNKSIDQYVFTLEQLDQNGNHKYRLEDIIHVFRALIESNGNEITVTKDEENLLNQILSFLDNGTDNGRTYEGKIGLSIIECKYYDNNKFNGIFSYIKQSTNGVVNGKNDHLRLKGRGKNPCHQLSNLLLYDDANIDRGYVNVKNGFPEIQDFIEFDFVNRKINMTSYTIRTIYNETNVYHPKTWKMIGSNDQIKWEIIDMKENNGELNGPYRCCHFECTTTGQYYRYIRYVQIDNWHLPYNREFRYYIGLSAIEFFGSIKSL